jgi:phosphoribosylamine--glycine ligase
MERRYLVVGNGGREHALAWKLAQRDGSRVFVASGNAGIAADPFIESCSSVSPNDVEGIASLAEKLAVHLTVVGPETPLCGGLVNTLRARRLPVFGPTRACAELEASKHFAKEIMAAAGIATADYRVFDDFDLALKHVHTRPHPCVIKADGLAGGKGVVISLDPSFSATTLREFMQDERFGAASRSVVIEDFLVGPEVSFMVVCDGKTAYPLATSRDHKRLLDGDLGPNTGGMGAIVPSPDTSQDLENLLMSIVINPVLEVMNDRKTPYTGFLYAGLMLTPDGPRVLEFNVRLGDPETQALLFGMKDDLGTALESAAAGHAIPMGEFDPACCVVLASGGYPNEVDVGHEILGLELDMPDTYVFHAGTASSAGQLVNAGGRVLSVTARGATPALASARAYERASKIAFDGMQFRRDIGA